MPTDNQGSVTRWLGDLKGGDQDAARPLWDRYFQRLVSLARARLRAARCGPGADEEDAALSAFGSFCDGAVRGRFPRLDNRDDFWRLLVKITTNKVFDQARRYGRLKRGGGHVHDEAALVGLGLAGEFASLDTISGTDPDPAVAASGAEQYHRLLEALGADELRRVALLIVEGHTLKDIAVQLGCCRRTVVNRLGLIRRIWERRRP